MVAVWCPLTNIISSVRACTNHVKRKSTLRLLTNTKPPHFGFRAFILWYFIYNFNLNAYERIYKEHPSGKNVAPNCKTKCCWRRGRTRCCRHKWHWNEEGILYTILCGSLHNECFHVFFIYLCINNNRGEATRFDLGVVFFGCDLYCMNRKSHRSPLYQR